MRTIKIRLKRRGLSETVVSTIRLSHRIAHIALSIQLFKPLRIWTTTDRHLTASSYFLLFYHHFDSCLLFKFFCVLSLCYFYILFFFCAKSEKWLFRYMCFTIGDMLIAENELLFTNHFFKPYHLTSESGEKNTNGKNTATYSLEVRQICDIKSSNNRLLDFPNIEYNSRPQVNNNTLLTHLHVQVCENH